MTYSWPELKLREPPQPSFSAYDDVVTGADVNYFSTLPWRKCSIGDVSGHMTNSI